MLACGLLLISKPGYSPRAELKSDEENKLRRATWPRKLDWSKDLRRWRIVSRRPHGQDDIVSKWCIDDKSERLLGYVGSLSHGDNSPQSHDQADVELLRSAREHTTYRDDTLD